ncbi:MAG: response regulator transcription factor [Achromobacter veterisilvae]|jgi:DNA-binding response OmpR family regulator
MVGVIVLEDEPVLRQELGDFLADLGYAPLCLANLEEFEQGFDPARHRLAIIDIGLPDGCGLELIQRLRSAGEPVGIIVFSARNTSADQVRGLTVGADHYLGKGSDLDVLAATLAALARRLDLRAPQAPRQPDCWRLDLRPRVLHIPGAPTVPLSQQDAVVLSCLMSRAGQNVARWEIIEALGEDYLQYDQRRLDTQMSRLRRRIGSLSGQALPVKTVRNSGFCFYQAAEVLK